MLAHKQHETSSVKYQELNWNQLSIISENNCQLLAGFGFFMGQTYTAKLAMFKLIFKIKDSDMEEASQTHLELQVRSVSGNRDDLLHISLVCG